MTKIDIFSGFLGAGKTTLIKKMINESFKGEKLVLIENEFGEIGIDGGFLKDAGINITEMNSGCICCSLVGDFGNALKKVLKDFAPDRILIEPSGVGKLSDVMKAVKNIHEHDLVLNSYTAVCDVERCKIYIKNFGEFYCDQVKHAKCIVLSHTANAKDEKIEECMHILREHNPNAVIVSTPWDELSGDQLLHAIEGTSSTENILKDLEHESECPVCGHHHDDHHDHHEHHEHHDADCCHHAHHHTHEDSHNCCEHDHHHCDCGHEHNHAHHHADDVFQSIGIETTKKITKDALCKSLSALADEKRYGTILRAKGIVPSSKDTWLHFDYIPGALDVREGAADIIGRICVIGAELHEDAIRALFELDA